MVNILIADDHALLRDGLKPYVSQAAETVVIHEASDFASARAIIAEHPLDLAMLDLRMPGMQGMAGAARLRQEFPDAPMAIISGWMTHEHALLAVQLGFIGYIPKSLSGTAILHVVRLMLCGESYYPPQILIPDPSHLPLMPEPPIATVQPPKAAEDKEDQLSLSILTRREKEILTHLVEGASNRKIAENLGLTEITIKSHLRNVFRKIGATNRTQAVTFALNCGIRAASDPTNTPS